MSGQVHGWRKQKERKGKGREKNKACNEMRCMHTRVHVGKERKRKGKERKGKERKGKERKGNKTKQSETIRNEENRRTFAQSKATASVAVQKAGFLHPIVRRAETNNTTSVLVGMKQTYGTNLNISRRKVSTLLNRFFLETITHTSIYIGTTRPRYSKQFRGKKTWHKLLRESQGCSRRWFSRDFVRGTGEQQKTRFTPNRIFLCHCRASGHPPLDPAPIRRGHCTAGHWKTLETTTPRVFHFVCPDIS